MTSAALCNTVCTCTHMRGNRSNKARIHVHFSISVCQESDIFMDFTLITKYFGFVDFYFSKDRYY